MRRQLSRYACGILLIWSLCSGGLLMASERLGQLKLASATTNLLNGRLTVWVPAQGKTTGMQNSIMAAPGSDAEVTRIEMNAGSKRMVLMAYEVFARTGKEFDSAVRKQTATFPMKVAVGPWPLSSPLRGYAYFPVTPTKDQEANLVMGVYVAQLDGTVQNLVFYANPSAAKDFSEAADLAKSISRTIAAGKKGFNTSAGDRELAGYSDPVIVTVPEGYATTMQNGVDFLVHHIRKIAVFGEAPASIGLYLGNFPSSPRQDLVKKGTNILFGKQAEWLEETSSENGQIKMIDNAVVALGRSFPSYAHVFLEAGDGTVMEELKKIASMLRFQKSARAK
jgi:hypothetical protein